ncbi:BsuPI-related putative proteinase inhibitor [Archangium lipolyticum]|uniref:BsuPI-related putative proteinase inhibitor n=1 Tax=Archangium lipolyticum TaxID=2970465 RepID=UPI00214A5FAC|nr:BsuPI-related putative proteinase inhibitor [Archangium lipolyticum]
MRIGTSWIASWLPVWSLALVLSLAPAFPALADPLSVSLTADKSNYERGEQATLTLEVKNTSLLPVTVSFSNGQRYDFAARDANGTTVWTWSHGKSFDPGSSSRTLAPGEIWRAQETWGFVDDAGSGVFDGTLTLSGTFLGQYLGRSGPKVATQDVVLFTPDPLQVTFSTDKSQYSRLSSSSARLVLTLTNIATYPVTITSPTEQLHDFGARNSSGQTVWTWSHGKTFNQTPAQLVLAPGESLELTGSWSFKNNSGSSVADGYYTVSGTFLGQYHGAVPPKGGESQIRVYTLF